MKHIESVRTGLISCTFALLVSTTAAGGAEPPFRHKPHESIACLTCHEQENGHGAVKIVTAADCTGCHHSRKNQSACASCHPAAELGTAFKRTVEFRTSASPAVKSRSLTFQHQQHGDLGCLRCHSSSPDMRVTTGCTSCHTEHHGELRNCTACHTGARSVAAHDLKSHLSCTGAGCHQDQVTAGLRTQRNVCLTCHENKVKHQPGGDCASCHMIPRKSGEKR